MLGDTARATGAAAAEGLSETYVCPEAFNGTYRVLMRRVWGKVTAGKVTVDVYSHYGTQQEKHLRQQIPLGDEDALVVFDLKDGRRKEPLAEQQLANAAAGQMAVNQAILAQQLNSLANPGRRRNANLGVSRQGLLGRARSSSRQSAISRSFMPLPSGTSMTGHRAWSRPIAAMCASRRLRRSRASAA